MSHKKLKKKDIVQQISRLLNSTFLRNAFLCIILMVLYCPNSFLDDEYLKMLSEKDDFSFICNELLKIKNM